jgi:hypothetical protein
MQWYSSPLSDEGIANLRKDLTTLQRADKAAKKKERMDQLKNRRLDSLEKRWAKRAEVEQQENKQRGKEEDESRKRNRNSLRREVTRTAARTSRLA